MNIDERLQALAESLELLTHDVHDLQEAVHGLKATADKLVSRDADIDKIVVIVRDNSADIRDLLAITKSHERRLDKIEVVQQWLAQAERRREIEGGKLSP